MNLRRFMQFIDRLNINKKSGTISYGYSQKLKETIKVGSIENEYKYINALTGLHGEQILLIKQEHYSQILTIVLFA